MGEKNEREKRGDAFLCWTERPVDFFLVLLAAAFGFKKKYMYISIMFVMQVSRMCCILRRLLVYKRL